MNAGNNAWRTLGKELVARRVALGYKKRIEFTRQHSLTSGQERTVEDLEKGRRVNYRPDTLAFVEQLYSWESGSIDAILTGGRPAEVVGAESPSIARFARLIPPAADQLPQHVQDGLLEMIYSAIRMQQIDHRIPIGEYSQYDEGTQRGLAIIDDETEMTKRRKEKHKREWLAERGYTPN